MSEQKRRLPTSIIVIAIVAAVFGLGTAAIIVKSSPTTQDNPVIVLPTANIRRLGVDTPAPDFTLKTFNGTPVSLKDLRGKRVLINFWASWCPPCLQETPDLVAAYKELGDSGVVFVGIGTQDDSDKLKKFAADNKVTYTILEDPKGSVSDAYSVLGLPTTVLVDSQGIVRKVFSGPVTKDQVITEIKKLG
ncbi:MAG: TlpA family protein disulfide reductase [Chloroflexi bacterium]|nr:TlpA family protein disulfide reductase [Chloroflexota bacterium]MCL5274923.1 TlpA family protein disulfide reductase [Chloroflexota bacterium]